MDVNRLKSELIVKAGRELDDTLQLLLTTAETLESGNYGLLSHEQREAVRGINAWAQQMKKDLAWMVEYISSRPPRMEMGDSHAGSGAESAGES
jgi:hypothetical protein